MAHVETDAIVTIVLDGEEASDLADVLASRSDYSSHIAALGDQLADLGY